MNTPTPHRFNIATLGCKVNAFESELIARQLVAHEYQRVGVDEVADLCLINTCTVTKEADRQARQLVRRLVRRNPAAWVVVTGCYAQIDPAACAAIEGVDWVVGNGAKLDLPALLARRDWRELPPVMVGDVDREISLPRELLSGFDGRARAFVQIQQGCDQGCTFCIIHKARGPNRSFAPGLIRRQVQRLVMNGHREVVICGVDIGSYGSDFVSAATTAADTTATINATATAPSGSARKATSQADCDSHRFEIRLSNPTAATFTNASVTDAATATESAVDLTALLRQLTTLPGDFRIRLSSIDPAHITDELIALLASDDKFCPQLHLSLQSADTLILKRMKRRATREMVYERIAALRRALPRLVLSADILVGFPTETEAQFARTLRAVDDLEIAYPHVFAYSPRDGTPAARIPAQVPPPQRKHRAAQVRQAGRAVWRRVAARRVGARARVLVEHATDGVARARAADYFPVEFAADGAIAGEFAEVEITGVRARGGDALIARRRQ